MTKIIMNNANRREAVDLHKSAVLRAVEKLLRPIAALVVRSGVMVSEVIPMFERACVDAAQSHMMINGKRNMTRVSLLTGMQRKKVAQYMMELNNEAAYTLGLKSHVVTIILSRWHIEPEYIDSEGNPKRLKELGPGPCLKDLVTRYGRDICSTKTVIEEMLYSGCINEENGYFFPLQRGYFPQNLHSKQFDVVGRAGCDLLETMIYNLYLKRDLGSARFQRNAVVEIAESQVPEFQEYVRENLDEALRAIDRHLTIKQRPPERGEETVRFGVGFFEINQREDN